MAKLKSLSIVLLAVFFICNAQAQANTVQNNDQWLLMSYLSQEKSISASKLVIQELINQAQVLFLEYEKDEPIKGESDKKNQQALVESLNSRGVIVFGISHHKDGETYPGISATFSKLSTYNYPNPGGWLEQMEEPINAGYKLKSVRIVYKPSDEIKTQSLELSKKVMTQIFSELKNIRSDYKQFLEYEKMIMTLGNWDDSSNFPAYPTLFYRYGYGKEIPNTKGAYEKTTENWCDIQIEFVQVIGFPQAQDRAGKTFPRQGITASWIVESDNIEFNEKVSDIIIKSLGVLDRYEDELEKRLSASSVSTRIRENSEKLKESDKELNQKWDLPDDVLAETTTDKLFLHFVRSPMVTMLMIYSNLEAGVQRLLDSSATLSEFYNRDDMAQGAVKMYREYDFSPESMNDENSNGTNSNQQKMSRAIISENITALAMDIYHADILLEDNPSYLHADIL